MIDTQSPLATVLYVDDEPDLRMLAQLALESMGGMSVTLCDSGAAALQALSTTRPQIILLDVMMPQMDGPALLQEIKKTAGLYDGPVIFLTGKTGAEDIAHLKSLGAFGVISKPFNPMTLHNEVTAMWRAYHEQS
jgi:CheY-like chemotaxis protein